MWRHLERDLKSWERWAAEMMETHLSYPLLAFYRSQHVDQNWLAALTAMVDVAAFMKATMPERHADTADLTFRIGSHALADLAFQFRLEPQPVDRLSEADFDELFAIVDGSTLPNLDRKGARRRLDRYRAKYEPNAQALAQALSLELPPWVARDTAASRKRTNATSGDVDLIGQSWRG